MAIQWAAKAKAQEKTLVSPPVASTQQEPKPARIEAEPLPKLETASSEKKPAQQKQPRGVGVKPSLTKGYSFLSVLPAPCSTLEDIWEKQRPISQHELKFRMTGRRASQRTTLGASSGLLSHSTLAQTTFDPKLPIGRHSLRGGNQGQLYVGQ